MECVQCGQVVGGNMGIDFISIAEKKIIGKHIEIFDLKIFCNKFCIKQYIDKKCDVKLDGGYSPDEDNLDENNPPTGGSGL